MKRLAKRAPVAAVLLAAIVPMTACDGDDPVATTPSPPAPTAKAPPAISGGTLVVTRDGALAVAADPGVDQIAVVDLANRTLVREVALQHGDEPGRVVEGALGQVHVALRGGGAIATLDLDSGEIVRRSVCPAPRGMAYDGAQGALHVACAGGELVTFSDDLAAPPTRMLRLARDLRDVTISGNRLMVSRFRSAEVLVLDESGLVLHATQPEQGYRSPSNQRPFEPAVAWRMQTLPDGSAAVVHQRGFSDEIPTGAPPVVGQSYYGGFCDQVIVHAAITVFHPDGGTVTSLSAGGIGNLVLPVDIAVSPDGDEMAVVGAGSEAVFQTSTVSAVNTDLLQNCVPGSDQTQTTVPGEPVAVAYSGQGGLVVQTRQPAALHFVDFGQLNGRVDFGGPSRRDVGHALFHRAAADTSPIACASCHPEGGDDGRVWKFDVGPRRTQNVSGGVMNTMPLHWDGEIDTLHDFVGEVFVTRMGGVEQPEDRVEALGSWLNQVPTLARSATRDADTIARGGALFNDTAVGCASCHVAGTTNNQTVDVGTGKAFQVPTLAGVANRAPFMHDGCAATLHDRFNPECGGETHGKTSHLSTEQIDDLVAYLETL